MLIPEQLLEPMFEASPQSDQIESGSDQETKYQLQEKTASSRVDVLKDEEFHRLALLREISSHFRSPATLRRRRQTIVAVDALFGVKYARS